MLFQLWLNRLLKSNTLKLQEVCTTVGNIWALISAKKSDNHSKEQAETVFASFNNLELFHLRKFLIDLSVRS